MIKRILIALKAGWLHLLIIDPAFHDVCWVMSIQMRLWIGNQKKCFHYTKNVLPKRKSVDTTWCKCDRIFFQNTKRH